jgi:spore germination cell wall hydrolase CwlJ-like protein
MTLYRKIVAGILGTCLLSASGVALVAAQAETVPARIAAPVSPTVPEISQAPVQPSAVAAEPAEPAAPAAAPTAPSPVSAADAALPATAVADAELTCLTRVILYEAGAESRAGQLAVAQVVLNRMRSGRFPRTICGVINQRGQFSAIRSFQPARNARWNRVQGIARAALNGERTTVGNALFFHARHVPAFRGRVRVASLGGHIFYR